MIIALEDLAAKRVKSTPEVAISDHTITLTNAPKDHELIFTGKGTRGLVFKDAKGKIIFRGAAIDNSSTSVTLKFDGVYDSVKVDGEGTSKLFGKAGNAASQMIYFQGTWSNIEVCGFEIDQRRDSKTGSTTTGSCLQFAGVPLKSLANLGKVHIHDMIFRNAGDETIYVNHFKKIRDDGVETADGEELIVERVKADGMGRDFGQQRGFRKVTFKDCSAKNIGLEAHNDHCSGFSLNDGSTEEILIDACQIENAKQFIYGGSTTRSTKAKIINSVYTQGTHAGSRANSALYLKGPGLWAVEDCNIDAPNVLQAAITADGSQVTYSNCKITAKDIDRLFNGGTVKEVGFTKRYPVTAEVEETTLAGVTTSKLLYNGKEFVI